MRGTEATLLRPSHSRRLRCVQINWRPDYDLLFFRHLNRQARRLYLFREEYIFELPRAIAVETPQLGHATYLFAMPRDMETFLSAYARSTKEDIRQNRQNTAEMLGFLGRDARRQFAHLGEGTR